MEDWLQQISKAYDLTVKQRKDNISPFAKAPAEFKNSKEFKDFQKTIGATTTGSNAPENKKFLNPKPGMKILDAGCCANLFNYRFDKWPSVYYGVDISPALIDAMKDFAEHREISVGGLEVAELAEMPFEDDFFDIASLIGVLEYADLNYCAAGLRELHRVLKKGARMVVDIPNMAHPHVQTMFKLEEYLGRPNIGKSRTEFELILDPLFATVEVDDSRVMLKYFVKGL
ncbi:MAG: class I SAM-dependent methyltransferase [Phycisphaerae bacterium]|nr:class I SAM-dependent methyltransferase [Phycisphaerae bacterium]